jgi:hypothetical protein
MNKYTLLIIIEILFCFNVVAQNNEKIIDELEWEVARLKNCAKFHSDQNAVIINSKTGKEQAITEIAFNADFMKFCQNYDKVIVDLDRLNIDKYPNKVPGNHIIYSTGQQNNKTEINMYYETLSKRPQVPTIPKRPQVYTNSQRPKIDKEIKEYISQLENIRNTLKFYQDLTNTLQHEINYNLVETVDNAGDLLLKHISIPKGDVLKEKAMEELKKKTGVEKDKPIKNELADIVNSVIDGSETIIELVPSGDKITNHYLWKLFKSTPEAGKGLGHFAASINIYFRKNEYKDKIQELKNIEQQLVRAIEEREKVIGK